MVEEAGSQASNCERACDGEAIVSEVLAAGQPLFQKIAGKLKMSYRAMFTQSADTM